MSTNDIATDAKKHYERKEYETAARLFTKAANSYQTENDQLMSAEMLNNASVSWLQSGDAAAALEVVTGTDEVFAGAQDFRRQAMALGNTAVALEELGRLSEAIDKYQSASDLLKEIEDKELRTFVLQKLAALQLRTGDQFQSLATMQAALENKKKLSLKERFLKKLLRVPFKMMK